MAGIFLIFAWILADQLFIQMKTIKTLGLRTLSSSNLSQLRKNLSRSHSQSGTVRSLGSVSLHSQRAQLGMVADFNKPPQSQQQSQPVAAAFPVFAGHYHQQHPMNYAYHTHMQRYIVKNPTYWYMGNSLALSARIR